MCIVTWIHSKHINTHKTEHSMSLRNLSNTQCLGLHEKKEKRKQQQKQQR